MLYGRCATSWTTCPRLCGKRSRGATCAYTHTSSPTLPTLPGDQGCGLWLTTCWAHRSQAEINQLDIQEAIAKWQRFPLDTGSGEVQVAIFTKRIEQLAAHLKRQHKDKYAKRRLIMLVSQRTRMLNYLRRKQRDRYTEILTGLNIRPTRLMDPTIQKHHLGTKTTWAARGYNKYIPKKRRARATPYGDAKTAKGRTRLRKRAVKQQRAQRKREKQALTEAKVAAREAFADKAA